MAKRRVVLKLSGEAFADAELGYGIDPVTVDRTAAEIAEVHAEGHEIAIVVGGGNIVRGLSAAASNMDRSSADYMGMLATVINAVAIRDALERADQAVIADKPEQQRGKLCRTAEMGDRPADGSEGTQNGIDALGEAERHCLFGSLPG